MRSLPPLQVPLYERGYEKDPAKVSSAGRSIPEGCCPAACGCGMAGHGCGMAAHGCCPAAHGCGMAVECSAAGLPAVVLRLLLWPFNCLPPSTIFRVPRWRSRPPRRRSGRALTSFLWTPRAACRWAAQAGIPANQAELVPVGCAEALPLGTAQRGQSTAQQQLAGPEHAQATTACIATPLQGNEPRKRALLHLINLLPFMPALFRNQHPLLLPPPARTTSR